MSSPLAVALGTAWGALVLTVAWRWRPPPARVSGLKVAGTTPAPRGSTSLRGALLPRGPAVLVGAAALRLARRPPEPATARRLGRAVLAGAATLPLIAPAAPAAGLAVWLAPALSERRHRAQRLAALVGQLPEAVDLLALAVGGGHNVALAVAAVAPRCPGPLGDELGRALRQTAHGRRLADALDELPLRLGEPVRPLVAALVASERYGAPLLDTLLRLADEVRHDRRRRAEEAARRVPVKLLFPLVLCILPAFALLTVAPLLAGGLRSLRL